MAALVTLAACAPVARSAVPPPEAAFPGLAPFDRMMTEVLTRWEVPGAALAVADGGRLVLARGYGQAAALFNSPPGDRDGFFAQLERGLHRAIAESQWPAYDLFERHP